jgi:hypothetical protein
MITYIPKDIINEILKYTIENHYVLDNRVNEKNLIGLFSRK